MSNLFYPAKIGRDVDYIWMITVDDHLKHVEEVGKAIGLKDDGLIAAKNHDLGKKFNLIYLIKKQEPETSSSFLKAYKLWLNKDIFDPSIHLLSPFPEHAKRLDRDEVDVSDYSYELIRHHHGFKVTEIVPLVNRFGKMFLDDLYLLIAADNICSAIYEKALTDRDFIIGDIEEDIFLLHDFIIQCKVKEEDIRKRVFLTSDRFSSLEILLNYHIIRREDLG
ncbi:MAG: hypothetical protein JRI65_11190 [Deltaproteobacteria bacterium]|nr:hypothetical protein [Deltaproteobacteria bacterium]